MKKIIQRDSGPLPKKPMHMMRTKANHPGKLFQAGLNRLIVLYNVYYFRNTLIGIHNGNMTCPLPLAHPILAA